MGRTDRVIASAIQTALRVVYPPRCLGCGCVVEGDEGLCAGCWRDTPFIGGTVCDSCGVPLPGVAGPDRVQCDTCLAEPPVWSQGRAALEYDGIARKLILGFKHGDKIELAHVAARWLALAAVELITEDTLIVPIPLHRWRLLRRRYNQSALLAQALALRTASDVCLDVFQRTVATPSLDGKSRGERARILDGAIAVTPRRADVLRGRRVLIVDDVLTTGATLSAATRAALAAGATEVCVLALARVVPRA